MRKLIIPLIASGLVAVAPPAKAEQIAPMGRVSNAQLYVLGGMGGGLPGIWLSPAIWHASDGDVFTWAVAGGVLGPPLWGITYGLLGSLIGPMLPKKEESK